MIVTCQLTDDTGALHESLTSVKWAWFDSPDPSAFIAPTDKGSAETTNTNGMLEVTISSSLLSVGAQGCLLVMNSAETTTGAYKLRLK